MSTAQISEKTLKHDINVLLTLFNEVDVQNTGYISKKAVYHILGIVEQDPSKYQHLLNQDKYEFDNLLAILGTIEAPQQPSVYVLSFIKILSGYRQKCLLNQDAQLGLTDAQTIDEKITHISNRQLERQKQKLLKQHSKIYSQLSRSQQKQLASFEDEWKTYLQQFKFQNYQKKKKTEFEQLKQLKNRSMKMEMQARKTSIITSPRMRQLSQQKKMLVKEGDYGKAIFINDKIHEQKRKISERYEQKVRSSVNKRVMSLQKKNQATLQYIEMYSNINLNKLLQKKKEGQNIMRVRMRSLRQEAQKKLNDHLRNELNRLRSALYVAAKN